MKLSKKKFSEASKQKTSQKKFISSLIINLSEVQMIETSTNTSKILIVIENAQKNSKKFVLIQFFVKINSILFETFSWQKSAFSYFSSSTILSKNDSNKKSFSIFETSEIVFIFTSLKTDLNQSLKLAKVISFRSVYSSTISRINVLKKKFQICFVSSSVNFFDFFNTFVFSFSISSISIRFVFSNYFSLKNFSKNSNIEKNQIEEIYRNSSIIRNEKFDSNETTNAEFSIRLKSRWEFKTFVKIDNKNEKIELNNSNNSKSFNESNQSKNSNDVDFNLNFTRSRIQKLKNSQSLFSFSKHHFSFNTSQFFSNTSMNLNENEQNEIDENDFSFELNLFQQNIQNIALFIFNLFRNNIAFKNDNVSNNNFSNDDWKKSFRAQNVEFFDFILNKSYDSDDVIQVERDVYYKNVYFFVEKIKNAVNMYTIEKIRFNLFNCLKKTIQIWYIENFNDFEKKTLRSLSIGVEKWCDALIKKFKQSISFALQFFLSKSYFFDDLKNKKICLVLFSQL